MFFWRKLYIAVASFREGRNRGLDYAKLEAELANFLPTCQTTGTTFSYWRVCAAITENTYSLLNVQTSTFLKLTMKFGYYIHMYALTVTREYLMFFCSRCHGFESEICIFLQLEYKHTQTTKDSNRYILTVRTNGPWR